ncbi:UNVERIFIED_CONTAM: hypothetical protein HDU68_005760, partial [Siphonaria sp. JEL0065]
MQSQQQPKQANEHSSNVITSLQTKLASTSNEFKSILAQNMKDQKNRKEQYTGSSSPSSTSFIAPVAGYPVQGAPQPSPFAAPQQPASASKPLFS